MEQHAQSLSSHTREEGESVQEYACKLAACYAGWGVMRVQAEEGTRAVMRELEECAELWHDAQSELWEDIIAREEWWQLRCASLCLNASILCPSM